VVELVGVVIVVVGSVVDGGAVDGGVVDGGAGDDPPFPDSPPTGVQSKQVSPFGQEPPCSQQYSPLRA
jgi:hypothetical protein